MQFDFAVLGANGIQGKIVVRDLLESGYSVLLCANDDYKLDSLLEYKRADLAYIDLRRIEKVKRVLKKSGANVVVNCAIDDYNLAINRLALELDAHYVDLGGGPRESEEKMTFEQLALDGEFKKREIVGIVGMGSTPGINNVMLRYVEPKFDTIHTVQLGFTWNSNMPSFVPPFSLDAIDLEFREKATVLENGKFILKDPEDCTLDYEYRSIGKQKTYYTKHIEPHTVHKFLEHKGVKNIAVFSSFPEHSRSAIKKLIELGFTSRDMLEIDGQKVQPLTHTIEILRRLPVPDGYVEKENLWVKVFGTKNDKEKVVEMDAVAGTLLGWEEHTCNVDTGMPVSITAQMIKNRIIAEPGMYSPEFIVPPQPFFEELGKRGIWIYENGRKINSPATTTAMQNILPQPTVAKKLAV